MIHSDCYAVHSNCSQHPDPLLFNYCILKCICPWTHGCIVRKAVLCWHPRSESGSLYLSLNPLQNPAANPLFSTPAGHLESEGAGLPCSYTWECLVYILKWWGVGEVARGGGRGNRHGEGGRDCFKLQCYESELGEYYILWCWAKCEPYKVDYVFHRNWTEHEEYEDCEAMVTPISISRFSR